MMRARPAARECALMLRCRGTTISTATCLPQHRHAAMQMHWTARAAAGSRMHAVDVRVACTAASPADTMSSPPAAAPDSPAAPSPPSVPPAANAGGGKGFGSGQPGGPARKGGSKGKAAGGGFGSGDKVVQEAIRSASSKGTKAAVSKGAGTKGVYQGINGPARPIDPREAARGKVDTVMVKEWGTGSEKEQLGELQVVSHQEGWYNTGRPLYEQLASELQAAESRGLTKVAGGAALPLEKWSFKEQRYVQYLADCHAVHSALEGAVAAGAAAATAAGVAAMPAAAAGMTAQEPQAQQPASAAASSPDAGALGEDASPDVKGPVTVPDGSGVLGALVVLQQCLRHLAASPFIAQDMQALRAANVAAGNRGEGQEQAAAAAEAKGQEEEEAAASSSSSVTTATSSGSPAQPSGKQQQQRQKTGRKGSKGSASGVPEAGQMARAYATYVTRLASDLKASMASAQPAPGLQAAGGSDVAAASLEAQQLGGRLLAHCYVVHVLALSGGLRFGAVAAEKLGLAQRRALAWYRMPGVQDPLKQLQVAVDRCGDLIRPHPAVYSALLEELPKAMQKASLLMAALAHEN